MSSLKQTLIICLLTLAPASLATELGGLLDQTSAMASDSLGSLLGSQLGISSDQAEGGVGGLFDAGREPAQQRGVRDARRCDPRRFRLSRCKARSLGLLDQPITSATDLTSALTDLGLNAPRQWSSFYLPRLKRSAQSVAIRHANS